MGDPRKARPKYETPKKVWDAERISEESQLIDEYGLKNMRELWIMKHELKKKRRETRRLLSMADKGKGKSKALLDCVVKLGLSKAETNLEDLLSLSIRDMLERRLQTRLVKKGMARTMPQARQLITHGFIAINGKKVSAPSYMVSITDEEAITFYKPFTMPSVSASDDSKPASNEEAAEAAPAEAAKEEKKEEAKEGKEEKQEAN
ncbi:MAG: 30S ribosomal protein S4 [Candidatus Micrarchaeota archaeon]